MKLAQKIKDEIVEALKDALMDSEELWEAFDAALQSDLENSSCWLEFNTGECEALVGLGEGDVAHTIKSESVEFAFEFYDSGSYALSPEQEEDITKQIAGIDKFISELKAAKQQLQKRLTP